MRTASSPLYRCHFLCWQQNQRRSSLNYIAKKELSRARSLVVALSARVMRVVYVVGVEPLRAMWLFFLERSATWHKFIIQLFLAVFTRPVASRHFPLNKARPRIARRTYTYVGSSKPGPENGTVCVLLSVCLSVSLPGRVPVTVIYDRIKTQCPWGAFPEAVINPAGRKRSQMVLHAQCPKRDKSRR
ncbi:hypothetical protein RRG08_009073 [Elysia crispata]|uniref:Uncharacterized protein n=1 Tax=Elysia crispata TaxID=231223 RepID=A0AAE0Y878_9GAST|nr:hypothetical protein RRG08_009073 [Elysia crispata]